MASTVNTLKPSVCFEVQKIIGISTIDGSCKTYQVQWAPSWISGLHLVGCDDLIQQFECEQTAEHIKIEEDDADPSQDICELPYRDNSDKALLQDDNLHDDSAPNQQMKKDIGDNIDTNTNPSSSQSFIHHRSNVNSRGSSLNSIIQNITQSNEEQYVGRNTVHPDFEGVKTNTYNVSNNSMLSIVQVDNKRQQAGDVRSDSAEAMVIVREASDCSPTQSSQLKDVQYFSGGNRDVEMPNNSFGRDVNINIDLLTEGGQSSRSYGKISLETKSEARRTFGCNICNKVFSTGFTLKNHSKLHKGIYRYTDYSSKTFTVKENLNKRELTHGADSGFSCNFCQEKFTDMEKLLVHIQVHKTAKGNPLECPYCTKRFLSKASVKVHTRVHTGECPFKCNICQRRFNVKQNLQRHLKGHVREDF